MNFSDSVYLKVTCPIIPKQHIINTVQAMIITTEYDYLKILQEYGYIKALFKTLGNATKKF